MLLGKTTKACVHLEMFLQLPLLHACDLGFSSLHERKARSGDVLGRKKGRGKGKLVESSTGNWGANIT